MRSHGIADGAGPAGPGSPARPAGENRVGVPPLSDTPTARVYRRAAAQLASVILGIAAVTAFLQHSPRSVQRTESPPSPPPTSPPLIARADVGEEVHEAPAPPAPAAEPPPPPPPPAVDRVQVAAAEAALDAASRDRARAEDRAAESARSLARTVEQAALDAFRAKRLAFQVRDPSIRIAQASARGGFLRGQRDRLATELATLRSQPRPKATSILSKSPVARPAAQDECHFELRQDRITFIDLKKLLELTRADAQLRIRMADRIGGISSKVGPAGAFSLAYELVPTMPESMEQLIERRNIRRFDLKGWELIPESEHRGETYEATQNPISEFTQAINRINPNRTTITLWVYPDSFGLYRRIRNDLVERGFSVAGRPLPQGLSIRGSPMGTQSAAQ
ncbi:MAG TPA: hypothetical protein VFF52_18650 [Isosphaeraceae bacterium]|nr:hypothetical protein [Isosphaeraceae bacterium]